MPYRLKEMVLTLQGEGSNAGRAVVLCRFEGCNLNCRFCDTDHSGVDGPGGGEFAAPGEVAAAAAARWQGEDGCRAVLCTGGEPLLQLDEGLVAEFHRRGFRVLVETNGTMPLPVGVDFVCVSPKEGKMPVIENGDELKLLYPLPGIDPADYLHLSFEHFYLQPLWEEGSSGSVRAAAEYCMEHPRWRLSLQVHKYAGIP